MPHLSALVIADYTVPVSPQPGFPFSEAMINHFQKFQQELQTTPKGKSHRFASVPHSRETMYSPLELPFTGFLFSRDSPVVDKDFTKISRSQVGGDHYSVRSRSICVTSQPRHPDGCVSPPSKIGRELPSVGPNKNRLITWALEVFPPNNCWNSLRQHYSCLSQ